MTTRDYIIWPLLVLLIVLALLPTGRLIWEWYYTPQFQESSYAGNGAHGFDWVHWEDNENGNIKAVYVFPKGSGELAGIRQGDELYSLEDKLIFNAENLKQLIQKTSPGETRRYELVRNKGTLDPWSYADVQISSYPTFLYPLTATLFRASTWGFLLGTFIHVLALIIVTPLAWRSRTAFLSLLLILASAVWVFGNTGRLLLLNLVGPPDIAGPIYEQIFEILTMVSLVGWILFPAFLLHKVLNDYIPAASVAGYIRWAIWIPAFLLVASALMASFRGTFLGPIALNALIGPILFYVCCYVATATGINLFLSGRTTDEAEANTHPGTWNRAGSFLVLILAIAGALLAYEVVPLLGNINDTTLGWLVVGMQLLSVAPVLLVSIATLKYGKFDLVVSRALAYLAILGSVFFAFVGGMTLLSPSIQRIDIPEMVIAGFYVVVLLFLFDRLGRRIHGYTVNFLQTERQRSRQTLNQFNNRMRSFVDPQELVQQTIEHVGSALRVSSAVLHVQCELPEKTWLKGSHHPEPPYLTLEVVERAWPHFVEEGRIWARNSELNESTLPKHLTNLFLDYGAVLAIPVCSDTRPIGLMILARKQKRRAVYNLEDVDLLRSIANHLALALDRLSLIEREKALIRTTANAQLAALRAQINPHFLFNALNTIASLTDEKPDEAVEAIEHLSAIFRHTLRTESEAYVLLREEIELVNHYLAIEQLRFGERLSLKKEFAPEFLDLPVPAFALQTLVENAIKHGLEKRREGGQLFLRSRMLSDGLGELTVHDTGPGIPSLFGQDEIQATDELFFGIGLRNVASRMIQLYNRNDLLRVASSPDEGTTVRLLIPTEPVEPNSVIQEKAFSA